MCPLLYVISSIAVLGTTDSRQVKFSNAYGVPFLAVNRGHGSTETLGALKYGIEIHIRVLNDITISADGTSALMQGGVYDDQVISTLWDAGFVTSKIANCIK